MRISLSSSTLSSGFINIFTYACIFCVCVRASEYALICYCCRIYGKMTLMMTPISGSGKRARLALSRFLTPIFGDSAAVSARNQKRALRKTKKKQRKEKKQNITVTMNDKTKHASACTFSLRFDVVVSSLRKKGILGNLPLSSPPPPLALLSN